MNWTTLLTASATDTYKATDALMALVDDADLGWKPASGRLTGDWGMPEGACADGAKDEMPMESMLPPAEALPTVGSVAEARRLVALDHEMTLAMIREAGEAKLDAMMVAAPWNPQHPQPLGRQFLGMVYHLDSHKSQLFYYLKLMGRDVNTMNLWGM